VFPVDTQSESKKSIDNTCNRPQYLESAMLPIEAMGSHFEVKAPCNDVEGKIVQEGIDASKEKSG
jgi:hypothetical protein